MYGCYDLMHGLMGHDLIDEYRLLVHPVLLGKGRVLLAGRRRAPGPRSRRLHRAPAGVAVLTYHPVPARAGPRRSCRAAARRADDRVRAGHGQHRARQRDPDGSHRRAAGSPPSADPDPHAHSPPSRRPRRAGEPGARPARRGQAGHHPGRAPRRGRRRRRRRGRRARRGPTPTPRPRRRGRARRRGPRRPARRRWARPAPRDDPVWSPAGSTPSRPCALLPQAHTRPEAVAATTAPPAAATGDAADAVDRRSAAVPGRPPARR